ncbi:MAG: hypothetical protein Q8K02_11955 [Flavobacterium sp.]|nr:hypothetical protein [Flavobacterium sp.]
MEDKSSWQSSEKMSKQPQGVSFQSINAKNKSFSFAPVPLSPGGERGLWHGCKNGKKAKRLWGFFAVLACGVGYFT